MSTTATSKKAIKECNVCYGKLVPKALERAPEVHLQPDFSTGDLLLEFTFLVPVNVAASDGESRKSLLVASDELKALEEILERDFGGFTKTTVYGCGERLESRTVYRSHQIHKQYRVVAANHPFAIPYFGLLKKHLQDSLDQQVIFMSVNRVSLI